MCRFDKKKVKCYKCSELVTMLGFDMKTVGFLKQGTSSFKLKELDKTEEPKALLSVDSMLNWSDHECEDVESGATQVYGMIAGAEEDAADSATGNDTGVVADEFSNAAAEFALMGISSQVLSKLSGMHAVPPPINRNFHASFPTIRDLVIYVYYGSKNHLELHNKPLWNNVTHIPSFVPKATSVPTGSRNRPTFVPAGSRYRPTSVPTGRPFSAGWKNNVARPMTRPSSHYFQHFSRPGYHNHINMDEGRWGTAENPHKNRDLGIVDSGCSRSMTGNKEKLDDFVKIVGVQTFNMFSVSQICDTKNKVLFTDKECLVLSKEFQLPENSQVVLRVPRRNNLYCFNLTDIKPERDVTCLLAKASLVESTKWHRRMAHVNFKNMNKLAKHGLVNGLPPKTLPQNGGTTVLSATRESKHKAFFQGLSLLKKIEETLNLRYLEDKPNVQGLGHEWYFDLDYLTDSLGYTRFKTNPPAGPTVNEASEMMESSTDYAEELARLQKQAYEANTIAEKHLSQADLATSRNGILGALTSPVQTRGTLKKSKFGASAFMSRVLSYNGKLKKKCTLGLGYPTSSGLCGWTLYLGIQNKAWCDDFEVLMKENLDECHGDKKSTTGGCQFLGRRFDFLAGAKSKNHCGLLLSIKAEYVAAC
ncbi:putative ribonuclease H-like domain-containing protein [Tanacetum coccineum]